MADKKSISRLLQIQKLEEEVHRLALESSQQQLNQAEETIVVEKSRAQNGRQLLVSSFHSNHDADRITGQEAILIANRSVQYFEVHRAAIQHEVECNRESFLAKRTELRRTETLIENQEAREREVREKKTQQHLDDWYLFGRPRREEIPEEAYDRDVKDKQNPSLL